MRACGWNVIDVEDGCYDILGLVNAMEAAKKSDRPTFINVRTVIGLGSSAAGTADAHGAAFGKDDVANMKRANGFDPEEYFVVPQQVRKFFAEMPVRGGQLVKEWESMIDDYSKQHPELASHFKERMAGKIDSRWKSMIPTREQLPSKPTATRASSGLVFNNIAKDIDSFMVGTADLSPSVHMAWPGKLDFNHVSRTGLLSLPLCFAFARALFLVGADQYTLSSQTCVRLAAHPVTTPGVTSTTAFGNTPCVLSPTVLLLSLQTPSYR